MSGTTSGDTAYGDENGSGRHRGLAPVKRTPHERWPGAPDRESEPAAAQIAGLAGTDARDVRGVRAAAAADTIWRPAAL
jgi:hypothetical protein